MVTRRETASIEVTVSWRNVTPGFLRFAYGRRTEARSERPNIKSSLEKPNTNASWPSMMVTSTSPSRSSESLVASSNPANPAPKIKTVFMRSSKCQNEF